MGMFGKGVAITLGAAVVGSIMMNVARQSGPGGAPTEAASPEDRCADRVGSHLPNGAFIVTHTASDASGRSEWLIDHGGLRERVACTAAGGRTVLTGLGHD